MVRLHVYEDVRRDRYSHIQKHASLIIHFLNVGIMKTHPTDLGNKVVLVSH